MGTDDNNDKVEDIQTFNAYNDADIVLRTSDGKNIWAHKLILARASAVFRIMFQDSQSELGVPVPVTEPASAFIDILQLIYPDFHLPPIQVREARTRAFGSIYYGPGKEVFESGISCVGGVFSDDEDETKNRLRLEEIERLRALLEFTLKYEMPNVQRKLTEAAKEAVSSCPIDCYAFALRYEINHQLESLKLAALKAISDNRIVLSLSTDTRRILKSGMMTAVEYYDLMYRVGTFNIDGRTEPASNRFPRAGTA